MNPSYFARNRTFTHNFTSTRLLALAAALALVPIACGDDKGTNRDGSDGDGGSNSGGNQNGSGGGENTGGGDTGGQNTGGQATGGMGGGSTGGMGGMGMGGDVNLPEGKVVFGDDYAEGVTFAPFGGSTNDLTVDTTTAHSGSASLKISVPASGYTGGALVAATDQDVSEFNAVVFWARASSAHTLDKVGFGNDGGGGTTYSAELANLALTTEWQEFVLPLPSPTALTAETGLFHFAEGEGAAYEIFLDDIQYVNLVGIPAPQPALATVTQQMLVGDTYTVVGTAVTYPFDSGNVTLALSPAWFDYESSDELVATVDDAGVVTAIDPGTSDITAMLEDILVTGTTSVEVTAATAPTEAAPTPIDDSADVISLYSNAYTNVTVDTWSTGWDVATQSEVQIEGNDTLLYTGLNYAGVEFSSATIDASGMQFLHVDVWMPASTVFKLKLVDFGVGGTYEPTGDNTEFEVSRTELATGTWVGLDFDLAEFTGMNFDHLAQMILVAESNGATVYIDNMYFYIN